MQAGHPVAQRVDVTLRVACEFRRQRVRGQIRGAHRDAQCLADPPRDTQHAALAVEVEPVARLDLDRRHAIGQQGARAGQGRFEQCVFAGRARGTHRRHDAAAGTCDLFVGRPLQTQLELAGPIAREHQVRMAIDQGRRDPTVAFDHLVRERGRRAGQGGTRTDEGEDAIAPAERTVGDLAIPVRALERRERHTEQQAIERDGKGRHEGRL
jgi:hypothetical protein